VDRGILSNGSVHVTDQSNVGVTGLVRNDGSGWDEHVLDVLRVPARPSVDRRFDGDRRTHDAWLALRPRWHHG
jgi:hypothetical protein